VAALSSNKSPNVWPFQKYFVSLQRNYKMTDMEAVRTKFNPIQLHILEMFNYCHSEESMNELKDVLADFYAKQVQNEADRLWNEGTLNAEAIDRILDEHLRTPYKEER
jgi:hypothetical protein